jgi:hypothetical protein
MGQNGAESKSGWLAEFEEVGLSIPFRVGFELRLFPEHLLNIRHRKMFSLQSGSRFGQRAGQGTLQAPDAYGDRRVTPVFDFVFQFRIEPTYRNRSSIGDCTAGLYIWPWGAKRITTGGKSGGWGIIV